MSADFDGLADYTLAELCICAAAEAWRGAGEVLATGITLIPRLAAGLARLTVTPELMMTDGECYLTAEPVAPDSESMANRLSDASMELRITARRRRGDG